MIVRIASGSSCSPRAVDPVTSANRMVTTLRTSSIRRLASSVPQLEQKRAVTALATPHTGQGDWAIVMEGEVSGPQRQDQLLGLSRAVRAVPQVGQGDWAVVIRSGVSLARDPA